MIEPHCGGGRGRVFFPIPVLLVGCEFWRRLRDWVWERQWIGDEGRGSVGSGRQDDLKMSVMGKLMNGR